MRRRAPAAERNRDPIADVLADELPATGLVLEIASGTGQHAVHFARRFPGFDWQPSDPDTDALISIAAWRHAEELENLREPIALDAASPDWPVGRVDAVVCINMVHISPLSATEGLMAGSGRWLSAGAPLVLYGPYLEDDIDTAPGNLAFDADLRARNPEWGLRSTSVIDGLAAPHGLHRTRRVAMPANNLTLIYRKR